MVLIPVKIPKTALNGHLELQKYILWEMWPFKETLFFSIFFDENLKFGILGPQLLNGTLVTIISQNIATGIHLLILFFILC
jgi:hypothetical protein